MNSGGSLSFNKYGDNKIVHLAGVHNSGRSLRRLAVSDNNRRIWVGHTDDGVAGVSAVWMPEAKTRFNTGHGRWFSQHCFLRREGRDRYSTVHTVGRKVDAKPGAKEHPTNSLSKKSSPPRGNCPARLA